MAVLLSKAIHTTGREGPQVCETSKLPQFLDNRHTDGSRVVSPTRRPPFTHPHHSGRFLVLISAIGRVEPRALVRLEGWGQLKNPLILSVIEPATFRLVLLLYVNQLRYRVPPLDPMEKRKIPWFCREPNHGFSAKRHFGRSSQR
jgi:hypothetical protein